LAELSGNSLGFFNRSGGPDGAVFALAFSPGTFGNNLLIVGGDFLNFGTSARARLAGVQLSFTPSDPLDMGFNIVADGRVRTIAVHSGRLLIGGDFMTVNGQFRSRLARIKSVTGNSFSPSTYWDLDTTFNPTGGANAPIHDLSVTSDGKAVVVGEFTTFAGTSISSVARLYGDAGSLPPGIPTNLAAKALSASQILFTFNLVSHASSYRIERSLNGLDGWAPLASQGTTSLLDSGLTPGTAYFYRVKATNSNGDGAFSAAVSATTEASVWTGAGSLDPNAIGTGAGSNITAVAIQPDGRVIIGGSFSAVHGVARRFIARLMPDWSVDPSFDPGTGPNSSVTGVESQADGKLIIAGYFSSVAGTPRSYLARLNADGSLDTSFGDPKLSTRPFAIGIQTDGRVLFGGSFLKVNGVSRSYLARLNSDGSLDSSFTAQITDGVETVSLQRDGRIVVGGWFSSGGGRYVARLLSNGDLDPSFAPPSVYSTVEQVAALNTGKILVSGYFTEINGVTRNRIARLNNDGTLDLSFNPGTGPNAHVSLMAPQPDGKVVIAGSFTDVAGVVRRNLARLNADGTLDTTFQPGAGTTESIEALAVAPDTRVVIGGSFTSFGVGTPTRVARLLGDGWSSPPATPTGLVVTGQSTSSVLVSWSDLPAEQAWTLERSANGSDGWMAIAQLPWDITSFTDRIAAPNTTVHYRLRASNGAGESPFSTNANGRSFTLFEQWKSDRQITLATLDTSDGDGDGVPLLVEYGLGLDPAAASASELPVYQVVDDTLAMSYRKHRSDVNYVVEASSDNATWSVLGVHQGSGPFPIAWKLIGDAPQMFLRLRLDRQ
jgi:uncharacterized delta-60 repeat protein